MERDVIVFVFVKMMQLVIRSMELVSARQEFEASIVKTAVHQVKTKYNK